MKPPHSPFHHHQPGHFNCDRPINEHANGDSAPAFDGPHAACKAHDLAVDLLPPDPEVAMAEADTMAMLAAQSQSAEVETEPEEKRVIAKVNRHLMPLFFSLALLCSLDRANLSFAALQLNQDLNFSNKVYGFGSGIFFLGYACFQIPATMVCARVGAPIFLGISLAAWGIVASCFATLRTSTQFYVMRFVLGLCETGAYPGMWYHMSLFFNDQELGVGYATVSTATAVNGVLGGPLAAALLSMDGLGGLRGWQWLFLLEGVPAVLLGFVLWRRLARGPATAGFLTRQERAWLELRQGQAHKTKAVGNEEGEGGLAADSNEPWWRFASGWRIWYLAAIWTLVTTAMDGLVFWAPTIISSVIYHGDDPDRPPNGSQVRDHSSAAAPSGSEERHEATEHAAKSALLSAVPFSCAAITMVVVARHSKACRERHLHGGIPLGVAAVGFAILPAFLENVPWLAFVLIAVVMSGIWAVHGPLMGWPAVFLKGRAAAIGFALIKMWGAIGSFVGPSAIGTLSDHYNNYTSAMLLLAGLLLVGSAMHMLFHEPGAPTWPLPWVWFKRQFKRSRSDPHRRSEADAFLPPPIPPHGAPALSFELPSRGSTATSNS